MLVEQSLVARFGEIVSRFPERTAVHAADGTLTYRELDDRSDRVASGLLSRRGSAAEPIGLLLSQSAALCAAILGVLKAGKFYVPMDPAHPPARNAQVLEDAGIPLTVDRAVLDTLLTGDAGVSRSEVRPDSLAYIYYTSGSTGRPKGVVDNHRNVLHNIRRYTNNLRITPDDRLTLLQGPAFSGAVSSLFCGLLNGATVYPYDLQHGMGTRLAEWVRENRITIYHSVPAIFRSLAASGGQFPSVRIIRLEGDAASRVDGELLRAHFGPHCRIAHGLGATETGLSRQFFVGRETALSDGLLPLGFATEDMHAAILSDDGLPVEPGAIGEIAIRSRYLAVGYWNQPELTGAAFTPTANGADERVYRTGDLGRIRPDGCLEYLGRKNAGFKIRGNRVEPAEVEHALLGLEGVREALVIGRPDDSGEMRLIAYLVPANGALLSPGRLRESLRSSLPEYLIPSRFMVLSSLPIGANGKIDRRALPWPPSGSPSATGYVAPRDPVERQLVSLWEKTLETAPIGVREDFFDLGGDSLRAAALLPELERIAGHELSPAIILTAPTIELLAAELRGPGRGLDPVLVPVSSSGDGRPLFGIPEHNGRIGLGLVGLGHELGGAHPFYALQAIGVTGREAPLPTITAMAARYRDAIRSVQPAGPYALAGRCFGAVVALELAHQLRQAGEEVDVLFFIDVTPEEFPGLVPEPVRRRFRTHRWVDTIRGELTNVRSRKLWKRGPYVIRELGLALLNQTRSRRLRRALARGELPTPAHWDVGTVSKQAFALHRSKPWPGHVSLLLREQDRARYGPEPALAWNGLAAGGCDIRFLPGPAREFNEVGQSLAVARLLREALDQPA